jgi:tetratricopeptide (TPR) repeat protein
MVCCSGKILACKLEALVYCENEDEEADNDDHSSVERLRCAARILGIQLYHLGLADCKTTSSNKSSSNPTNFAGWGVGGYTAEQRLGCALRAVLRDVGADASARRAAMEAADELHSALLQQSSVTSLVRDEDCARSPDLMLRFGALGMSAAATVVSAFSPLSAEERSAGLEALRSLLTEEVSRCRVVDRSIMVAAGEDSGGADELLLRLALVQALLESRREAEALEEARFAAKFEELRMQSTDSTRSPAVSFLLGRCLLRLGNRADGISALERAETHFADSCIKTGCEWLSPLWLWGRGEAARYLSVHRIAERCNAAAVETYARGSFDEAAILFAKSISILQAGFPDDKRGRAATFADRAGCLRRARKLDEAVSDLDAALRLFPRYTRALFRRAACLLEAGNAEGAMNGKKCFLKCELCAYFDRMATRVSRFVRF